MSFNFLRSYSLTVKKGNRVIVIEPPLRIAFDGIKNTGQGVGVGANGFNFEVYGLGKESRDMFFRDPIIDQRSRTYFDFKVGYDGNLKTIFSGTLYRGVVKLTDNGYVCTANCFSGGAGYIGAFTSKTVTTKQGAIDAAVKDIEKEDDTAKSGFIEKFKDLVRPKVLYGSSSKIIEDSLQDDEEFYIDNGLITIKKKGKAVGNFVPLVDAESGLMNTPERESLRINFDTILNPNIRLGGNFKLESKVAPIYNGIYQAIAISYSGDTEGADWKQNVTGAIG